ncbi:MAG: zinc-binding alcohol dehydrogenase [Bacteroidota bacterium]
MIALWHIDSNTSVLRNEKEAPAKHQIFKSKYSMISTGTERLIARGQVDSSFHDVMKVPYQSGDFDFPIKYGYSLIVENKNGDIGHIMHPHQDEIDVNQEAITWATEELPPFRFALISNMETILNAIWDSRLKGDEAIAICGFGNIGALLANTLRIYKGIEATIFENNAWRREKAISLGWSVETEGLYDILFHTTATEGGLQFCLEHLNYEGKLVELSWYGSQRVNIELGKDFHYKRLMLISSQVSNIPGHMKMFHTYESRKKLAFDILKDDSFDALITNKIPFRDAPAFFERLRTGDVEEGLIYLIEY